MTQQHRPIQNDKWIWTPEAQLKKIVTVCMQVAVRPKTVSLTCSVAQTTPDVDVKAGSLTAVLLIVAMAHGARCPLHMPIGPQNETFHTSSFDHSLHENANHDMSAWPQEKQLDMFPHADLLVPPSLAQMAQQHWKPP